MAWHRWVVRATRNAAGSGRSKPDLGRDCSELPIAAVLTTFTSTGRVSDRGHESRLGFFWLSSFFGMRRYAGGCFISTSVQGDPMGVFFSGHRALR